jgi:hypothetical protein
MLFPFLVIRLDVPLSLKPQADELPGNWKCRWLVIVSTTAQ